MHQVSMALRAFFTREMRTSRRKGRSRLLCTVAEFTQNNPVIIFLLICMYRHSSIYAVNVGTHKKTVEIENRIY